MATSGRTTSHFLTWYSIHSRFDRDVPLEEAEPLVVEELRGSCRFRRRGRRPPVNRTEDPPREGVADETVDAEDEDAHRAFPPPQPRASVQARKAASFMSGCPSGAPGEFPRAGSRRSRR